MSHADPQNRPTHSPEWVWRAIVVGMYLLILGCCEFAPLLLERQFGIWFGLLGVIAALICWIYLVPPTKPGFALLIALYGLFTLILILIVWLFKAVQFVTA